MEAKVEPRARPRHRESRDEVQRIEDDMGSRRERSVLGPCSKLGAQLWAFWL